MSDDIYTSGEYASRFPAYHVEDSAWKARQITNLLEGRDIPVATVCEIGCGAGEVLRQLQLRMPDDARFSGFDISPDAIAACRAKATDRLTFYCEDLLTRTDSAYDLMLCIDVFEHVADYIGFLRKLQPKARYTVFHIPLDMSAQSVTRNQQVGIRNVLGHLHYFTKDTALATLTDCGYEVVRWSYTMGGIDLPKSIAAKLSALPRRLAALLLGQDMAVRLLGGCSLLALTRPRAGASPDAPTGVAPDP
ncbi:MAG: class I SAM-dependent methyltransferase [Armatimonadetes bacterium]|nr:class I SAM-dependent methyltransferase [Armatimonadota bacterium]